MSTNKALVLIDGSNVYFAQKIMGKQLDWVKVLNYLKRSYTLIEIKYYAGVRKGDFTADSFFKKLGKIGIQVITKKVKTVVDDKGGTFEKCNFDVEIGVDAIKSKGDYDTLILMSGDSDFAYLRKVLVNMGKRVIVYSTRDTLAWELKLSGEYVFLEDIVGLTRDANFVRL